MVQFLNVYWVIVICFGLVGFCGNCDTVVVTQKLLLNVEIIETIFLEEYMYKEGIKSYFVLHGMHSLSEIQRRS